MESSVRVSADGHLEGTVAVPPSKSYTHRAVVMASLAEGQSRIAGPLLSRDTRATIGACAAMGARILDEDSLLEITGTAPRSPKEVVDVENSGSTLRFMTSVFSLAPEGSSTLTGDASIRTRPMQPLLDALGELGVDARSTRGNGCAPIVVRGGGMRGGRANMRGDVSSQFVSSILISSPLARSDTTIEVSNAVSKPYLEATLRLSRLFGASIDRDGYSRFAISGGQAYRPTDFRVPGDYSSASFIMAAVAIAGGRVVFTGLDDSLPQGDSAFAGILTSLGVRVARSNGSVTVEADGKAIAGGTFDLSNTPDLLPAVSVLALRASSPIEVTGVAHARFKETDRIRVLSTELRKSGVRVEERDDGVKIEPSTSLNKCVLDAHDDHRMFMAFALASLASGGRVAVLGEDSLDVSYPQFLNDMERIGAAVARE
ncbi:MAG: 3-phosphoshikimate 1-carboxyvinyltransferase [archaeon]|nr:MAG: 3-phosphoshikimate 1-carboxyvinyltransferase [archaeon]